MWRSRIFWRLFLTYGALVLAAISLLGAVIANRVEEHYLRQMEDSLRARAILIADMVRGSPAEQGPMLQQRMEAVRQDIATRVTLLDRDGNVLADSERDPAKYNLDVHANRPEVVAAREARFGIVRQRHSATVRQEMMYVALRTDDERGAVAYVRVALPLDSINEQLGELRRLVWTAAAVASMLVLLVALWLAWRGVRPLRELTRAAEDVAAGDYDRRVYAFGHDELGTLARTFNHMSERLADQFTQLEADRQQLRTILSGMVEGVVALDAEQRLVFANERAARLLGFQGDSAVGRKLWEVVRQRSLQDLASRALAGPEAQSEELTWSGPGGRSLRVHGARLPGSPPRGVVLVLHDTTDLRRLERLRQEFVANVSHELKTPLSVIKACVETLLDGAAEDPVPRKTFLQQVSEQADRLHALVLDLLSLARIESGTEIFHFENVPVTTAVGACLERHRARAEAKNQKLEAAALPADDTVAAWVDAEALGQILDNLVDNALKYTSPDGQITLRCRVEEEEVHLEVEDSGIGIPEQDLSRIFERFYRVDKARSRELGGTGLGLSIVKHLVQALHGSVRATSVVGQGTKFTVSLPRALAS